MQSNKADAHALQLQKLIMRISESEFEGVILVPGPNMRYCTGVSSLLLERPFLLFIPKDGEANLLAPTFESGPYLRTSMKITVHAWNDGDGPSKAFEQIVAQLGMKGRWGVEGRVPFRFIQILMKHAHPELQSADPILESMREVKSGRELRFLQRSARILSDSFLKIPSLLKPGITESELAKEVKQEIYSHGAEMADDVLVQSGAMAADPHHLPTSRRLRRNESIVVDATCTYSGYYADITRTFIMGAGDRKLDYIYENVLEAQNSAIEISGPGQSTGSIDKAARNSLKQRGLDRYFIHRTGHGLGLEVHEPPYIVPEGKEALQRFMVYTVEPGVYVPKKLGVRIEDDIATTESGVKVLTKALPKEMGWWR